MTRTQRGIDERRRGDAVAVVWDGGRPCPGLSVWVEQESHAFPFGCVAPDLRDLSAPDQTHCRARLGEVFNRLIPPGRPPSGDAAQLDVPDRVHLGVLRVFLDKLSAADAPLDVHLRGQTIGMTDTDERDAARRLADLYTLCFAHPAVGGLFWNGFRDGEPGVEGGLVRRDLSPKPAFRLLQKLIGVVWHTRADGVTDAEGRFRFRGFFGDYRVGVKVGEETKVSTFTLHSGSGSTPAPIPADP